MKNSSARQYGLLPITTLFNSFLKTYMQTFIRYFRLLAATILSFVLAACGGYTTVSLGGKVTGLTTDGLVLANGNDTITVPANATEYTFPQQIDDQAQYAVTIQTQPQGLTCTLANATGSASGIAITSVNVTCTPTTHNVGGTIGNLTVAGLELNNGSDTVSPDANSTTFTFPGKVAEGALYGVTVVKQPTGQTCSVANGTGVMGTADVTNIQVTCM